MVVDKSRSMRFQTHFEHFRTMTLNVYFLLLTLSVYAAPNSITTVREIMTTIKMIKNVMKDDQRLKIPTPVNQNIADCASIIFDGIDLLEKQPEMQKFSNIFSNLKNLKTSLQKNLKTRASCDTESVTVSKFIKKLEDFIKTQHRTAKH